MKSLYKPLIKEEKYCQRRKLHFCLKDWTAYTEEQITVRYILELGKNYLFLSHQEGFGFIVADVSLCFAQTPPITHLSPQEKAFKWFMLKHHYTARYILCWLTKYLCQYYSKVKKKKIEVILLDKIVIT